MNKKRYVPVLTFLVMDILLVILAGGVALLVRFDFAFGDIPGDFLNKWMSFLPVQLLITVVVFAWRKMYHYIWQSVSAHDVAEMLLSVVLAFVLSTALSWIVGRRIPISCSLISLMLQLLLLLGIRCAPRFYEVLRDSAFGRRVTAESIMLIGAGEAGRLLLREIMTKEKTVGRVRCIIDDDPLKWGKYLEGVRICGDRKMIRRIARKERITQIIFAIPSASAKDRKEILELCGQTSCRVRILPELFQLVSREVTMAAVKDIQVEDLLGREPVQLDMERMNGFLSGKIVLVTGGGGSIGSELCRQIAQYSPRQLLILDIYENCAYELEQELRRIYGDKLHMKVLIASIRDQDTINRIFQTYRPEIVFHAAAHKHVPLMEACPEEAIKNNIFGTYHVVQAAERYGVEKFVMISSDKAVNPTNVMGATKRFCEMILQTRDGSDTEFVSVRFGNVLGSNGSVVPLFKRQIREGGPVTITDKRMIRYFMTIPEAAQLVLEAGSLAKSHQTFVLDMGEPVKILTLAENLIQLSGLTPYRDIEIREIGLRPGEKLYEELLMNSDSLTKTSNAKIFIDTQDKLEPEEILRGITRLENAIAQHASSEALVTLLKQLVPTYQDPDEANRKMERRMEEEEEQISLYGVAPDRRVFK